MKRLSLVPLLLTLAACSGAAAEAPPTATAAVEDTRDYTCPMHHDVHHQGPGSCPKCGMVLKLAPVVDPTKETSAGYAIGVAKIAEDRAQLQTLLDGGKLADLHKVAEGLSKKAKALPSTCDSLGDAQKADVTARAQALQDLFAALDEAGDSGKKEEAAAALKAYDAPIAALQAYLP